MRIVIKGKGKKCYRRGRSLRTRNALNNEGFSVLTKDYSKESNLVVNEYGYIHHKLGEYAE